MPGFHVYFKVGERTTIYGDIRTTNNSLSLTCVYNARVYTPSPGGTQMPMFFDIESAKRAVEQECITQSL